MSDANRQNFYQAILTRVYARLPATLYPLIRVLTEVERHSRDVREDGQLYSAIEPIYFPEPE
jgi:hypothetical protein